MELLDGFSQFTFTFQGEDFVFKQDEDCYKKMKCMGIECECFSQEGKISRPTPLDRMFLPPPQSGQCKVKAFDQMTKFPDLDRKVSKSFPGYHTTTISGSPLLPLVMDLADTMNYPALGLAIASHEFMWKNFEMKSGGNYKCRVCRAVIERTKIPVHMRTSHFADIIEDIMVTMTESFTKTNNLKLSSFLSPALTSPIAMETTNVCVSEIPEHNMEDMQFVTFPQDINTRLINIIQSTSKNQGGSSPPESNRGKYCVDILSYDGVETRKISPNKSHLALFCNKRGLMEIQPMEELRDPITGEIRGGCEYLGQQIFYKSIPYDRPQMIRGFPPSPNAGMRQSHFSQPEICWDIECPLGLADILALESALKTSRLVSFCWAKSAFTFDDKESILEKLAVPSNVAGLFYTALTGGFKSSATSPSNKGNTKVSDKPKTGLGTDTNIINGVGEKQKTQLDAVLKCEDFLSLVGEAREDILKLTTNFILSLQHHVIVYSRLIEFYMGNRTEVLRSFFSFCASAALHVKNENCHSIHKTLCDIHREMKRVRRPDEYEDLMLIDEEEISAFSSDEVERHTNIGCKPKVTTASTLTLSEIDKVTALFERTFGKVIDAPASFITDESNQSQKNILDVLFPVEPPKKANNQSTSNQTSGGVGSSVSKEKGVQKQAKGAQQRHPQAKHTTTSALAQLKERTEAERRVDSKIPVAVASQKNERVVIAAETVTETIANVVPVSIPEEKQPEKTETQSQQPQQQQPNVSQDVQDVQIEKEQTQNQEKKEEQLEIQSQSQTQPQTQTQPKPSEPPQETSEPPQKVQPPVKPEQKPQPQPPQQQQQQTKPPQQAQSQKPKNKKEQTNHAPQASSSQPPRQQEKAAPKKEQKKTPKQQQKVTNESHKEKKIVAPKTAPQTKAKKTSNASTRAPSATKPKTEHSSRTTSVMEKPKQVAQTQAAQQTATNATTPTVKRSKEVSPEQQRQREREEEARQERGMIDAVIGQIARKAVEHIKLDIITSECQLLLEKAISSAQLAAKNKKTQNQQSQLKQKEQGAGAELSGKTNQEHQTPTASGTNEKLPPSANKPETKPLEKNETQTDSDNQPRKTTEEDKSKALLIAKFEKLRRIEKSRPKTPTTPQQRATPTCGNQTHTEDATKTTANKDTGIFEVVNYKQLLKALGAGNMTRRRERRHKDVSTSGSSTLSTSQIARVPVTVSTSISTTPSTAIPTTIIKPMGVASVATNIERLKRAIASSVGLCNITNNMKLLVHRAQKEMANAFQNSANNRLVTNKKLKSPEASVSVFTTLFPDHTSSHDHDPSVCDATIVEDNVPVRLEQVLGVSCARNTKVPIDTMERSEATEISGGNLSQRSAKETQRQQQQQQQQQHIAKHLDYSEWVEWFVASGLFPMYYNDQGNACSATKQLSDISHYADEPLETYCDFPRQWSQQPEEILKCSFSFAESLDMAAAKSVDPSLHSKLRCGNKLFVGPRLKSGEVVGTGFVMRRTTQDNKKRVKFIAPTAPTQSMRPLAGQRRIDIRNKLSEMCISGKVDQISLALVLGECLVASGVLGGRMRNGKPFVNLKDFDALEQQKEEREGPSSEEAFLDSDIAPNNLKKPLLAPVGKTEPRQMKRQSRAGREAVNRMVLAQSTHATLPTAETINTLVNPVRSKPSAATPLSPSSEVHSTNDTTEFGKRRTFVVTVSRDENVTKVTYDKEPQEQAQQQQQQQQQEKNESISGTTVGSGPASTKGDDNKDDTTPPATQDKQVAPEVAPPPTETTTQVQEGDSNKVSFALPQTRELLPQSVFSNPGDMLRNSFGQTINGIRVGSGGFTRRNTFGASAQSVLNMYSYSGGPVRQEDTNEYGSQHVPRPAFDSVYSTGGQGVQMPGGQDYSSRYNYEHGVAKPSGSTNTNNRNENNGADEDEYGDDDEMGRLWLKF